MRRSGGAFQHWRRKRGATGAGWLAAVLAVGCAHRTSVCSSPGTCGTGRICAAGRCARPGTDPIASDSDRIVVAASDIAIVSASAENGALPDEIAFFGRSPPVVLLRFPAPWGNRARIMAAFLTLQLQDTTVVDSRTWTLSVARVLEPWAGAGVSWGRLPRLSAPLVRAEVVPLPPRSLRIDVTAIVQRWARAENDERGLALWASAAGPSGPTFSSGLLGPVGPRLDVYVR
jgi:hypothetical protein